MLRESTRNSDTAMFAFKSPSYNLCRQVLKLGMPRCTALYQSPQFSHCFSWVSHMRVMRRQVGTCTLCTCLLKPVLQRHSTFHEGRAFLETNPYNIFYGDIRMQIPIMQSLPRGPWAEACKAHCILRTPCVFE